jgi:RNA polymerase sporulation-specific sigma factor
MKDEAALKLCERIMIHLVERFVGVNEREDLMQQARLGTLKAVREYDPSKGASFKTFAFHCIHNSLRRYGRANTGIVYFPERAKSTPTRAEMPLDWGGWSTADSNTATDITLLLRQIADTLTDDELHAINRRYFESAEYKVVAAEIGRDPRTVCRSAINKMRKRAVEMGVEYNDCF